MIERVVRNDEVVGLIPIWSTNFSPIAGGCVPLRLGSCGRGGREKWLGNEAVGPRLGSCPSSHAPCF